ncbi:hypothetical protein MMC25_003490 [Agyrium rufum]|nr:hypothetical protein [Agyrium rufum]
MPAPRATTSDGRLELISPMAMDSQTTQQDTLAMMPPKRVLPFLERVSKANRSGTTDDAATSNKKPALSTTVERSTKRRRVDNSDPHVSSEESAKRPSGSASKVPKESQLPKTSNIVLSRVGKRMAQTDVATNLNARPPTIGSSSNAKGTSNGPEVNAPWKGESQLDEDDKMMEYLLEQFSGRAAEVIDATRAPITDFSAYAKIPEKKRLEAMEQYMIAAILDDGFLKVMEDVEVCWKRIGFET